jgi:alpha-beta hydrolase superfamily lysophospholipase
LLLISGTHDPATNFGEEAKDLNELFGLIGIKSKLHLNFEGRHDSFQEINKIEIYDIVVDFLD